MRKSILFFALCCAVTVMAQKKSLTAEVPMDYSYCGYHNSEKDIPMVDVVVRLSPDDILKTKDIDQSAKIQRAIDYVSSLKPNADGHRGTVLLDSGYYYLDRPLRIEASGVVLRGADRLATVLLKRGYDRGAVVYVEGKNDIRFTDTLDIASSSVPLNARSLAVTSADVLRAGDNVMIWHPSTKEWIESLGCYDFGGGITFLGWKPGDIDMKWDRTVVASAAGEVTLNAPLAMALDEKEADSKLIRYTWNGRIAESGVENLTIGTEYDPAKNKNNYPSHFVDEDHAWTGVYMDNARDCWVRDVSFARLAGSAVVLHRGTLNVTVENCISYNPISEIGGMRRRAFLTFGQHSLFVRCQANYAINAFSAGNIAAGPNAFVQCEAYKALGFSGSTGSWACGLLFDIVDVEGHDIMLANLGQDKLGAGWNAANSTVWQCSAAGIHCYAPSSTTGNVAIGCWAQFSGNGKWLQSNNHVQPRSLFEAQLNARGINRSMSILPRNVTSTSSPTIEQAVEIARESREPLLTLVAWIDSLGQNKYPLAIDTKKLVSEEKIIKWAAKHCPAVVESPATFKVGTHITFAADGSDASLSVGNAQNVRWWNGNLRDRGVRGATGHVTRFVPDMEGQGLTDRIDTVVADMAKNSTIILNHNYGLWYDRRRDDHERVQRRDGDVWAPFYDQPFARTGVGKAWDGLSRYDLTSPNLWYWHRLAEFADKAENKGVLLFHNHYFQHNIIEAGAHWVDCPWRTANNINEPISPEPVNFAGDKRVFMADIFYDIKHSNRAKLHRNYIREALNRLDGKSNVVHLISEEYTGPLHFMQFWLDCIDEWQRETGKDAIIALSATKDVQDAILADAKRAAVVDIIDIRYWHYRNDSTLYAPPGGKSMAPRQYARKEKPGLMRFSGAYRSVSEYRLRYPEKAVTLFSQDAPQCGWAVLMAGGSCPNVPQCAESAPFFKAVPQMEPVAGATADCQQLEGENGRVVYLHKAGTHAVALPSGTYALRYIDPTNSKTTTLKKKFSVADTYTLDAKQAGAYWFEKL